MKKSEKKWLPGCKEKLVLLYFVMAAQVYQALDITGNIFIYFFFIYIYFLIIGIPQLKKSPEKGRKASGLLPSIAA